MTKQKLDFYDFDDLNIYYFAFSKVSKLQVINNFTGEIRKIFGYRYVLDKPLTDEQKEKVLSYKNTELSSCAYRYAKEITHDTLILWDKKIR